MIHKRTSPFAARDCVRVQVEAPHIGALMITIRRYAASITEAQP
jgi:hypothetical protein